MTSDPLFWMALAAPIVATALAAATAFYIAPRFDAWADARFPARRRGIDPAARSPAE